MKRYVKIFISLLIFSIDIVSVLFKQLFKIQTRRSCTVIYYHDVSIENRGYFAEQMNTLLRWSTPIAIGTSSINLNEGIRYSMVTFDDGFTSVFENAYPEMLQKKIPATVFITTASMGGTPKWIKGCNNPVTKDEVVSPSKLSQFREHNLLFFGSHCVTHTNLLLLEENEIIREFSDSRLELSKILDRDVDLLSFPHGAFNSKVLKLAKKVGFKKVFTIVPKVYSIEEDDFIIGRVKVDPTDYKIEFFLKIFGAYRWMAPVSAFKHKILNFFHK